MEKVEPDSVKMSKALVVWGKRNNIRPIQFCAKMGWSYNYAFRVLRGHDRFTPAAWGKFLKAYGREALAELLDKAGVDPKR